MSDEPGPCFGFKKKTVVMTTLALLSLTLVVWTLVITSREQAPGTAGDNVTSLVVGERQDLDAIIVNEVKLVGLPEAATAGTAEKKMVVKYQKQASAKSASRK